MTDIDRLMHRFRDYVEPSGERAIPEPTLRSRAPAVRHRQRIMRPVLVAMAGGLAAASTALFVRTSHESKPTMAQGQVAPTWGTECDLTVTPTLGESQTVATARALRVLDARARAVAWTSYRFTITNRNTITARIQASRCADDLGGLTAQSDMSIADLTRAAATDLTGNDLPQAVRSLHTSGGGTPSFVAVSSERNGTWNLRPATTESLAADFARRTGGRVLAVPAGYEVVSYEPSTARRPAAIRARDRRFAILRRSDDLVGPYEILDAHSHGSDLDLELTAAARAKVRAAIGTDHRGDRARLILVDRGQGWSRGIGAVTTNGSTVLVDLPSTDPIVSRGYAASLAGGMLPSTLRRGTPHVFGKAPALPGEHLTEAPKWARGAPASGAGQTYRRVVDATLQGTRWQVVISRDETGYLRAWVGKNGRPLDLGFERSCGTPLGGPMPYLCGLAADPRAAIVGQVTDPSYSSILVAAKSQATGTEVLFEGTVANGWFLVPPLPAGYVARSVVAMNPSNGAIGAMRKLPDQGFIIFAGG